jgi:hypothetical protein
VGDKVHYIRWSFDEPWPFDDNFFDVALDSFAAATDIDTPEGMKTYREQMLRTLKPRGIAMVTVYDRQDDFEAQARVDNPGPGGGAYWPNGKLQNVYDPDKIRELYEKFHVLVLDSARRVVSKFGANRVASTYFTVLQKPAEPMVLARELQTASADS